MCYLGRSSLPMVMALDCNERDSMKEMIWTLKATNPNHCSVLFHQHVHEAWYTFGPTEVDKDSFEKRTTK